MSLRQELIKISLFSWCYHILRMARVDLSRRGWGVLCQAMVGWLPDWFCFNFLRVGALWLAGAKLPLAGGIVIRKGVFSEEPSRLQLGVGVQINRNTYIGSNAMVIIGPFARIAMNVQILTVSHDGTNFETDVFKPVLIGGLSHIGAGAILLPGTEIGEGTWIAPGTVVSGATKAHGVYVGNPARFAAFKSMPEVQ